jgi:hypothetical protein
MHIWIYTGRTGEVNAKRIRERYPQEISTCETMFQLTQLQKAQESSTGVGMMRQRRSRSIQTQDCYQQYVDCPSNTFRASFSATSLQLI